MTSIRIYDPGDAGAAVPALSPLPIGALAVGAQNLLQEAADLPAPCFVAIFDTQSIHVQFEPERPSLKAVARWALRFGGIVMTIPQQGENGPETWCHTEFAYYGVAVGAYAHIPAAPASI